MNIYAVVFITLIAALIASDAQLMYKRGLVKRHESFRDTLLAFRNRWVIYGLVLYAVSLVIYLYALAHADLSIVYPTFASVFIFVMIISMAVLKECINATRALGIFIVFAGIAIVAYTI